MIIWMGVGGELDVLNLLFNQLETSLGSIGIAKDTRGYSPHITLGREVRLAVPFSKVASAVAIDHQQQIIEVHKISLMESKREEGRLMYIPLHRQPLAD
jgi:2'-5' RNA ligase